MDTTTVLDKIKVNTAFWNSENINSLKGGLETKIHNSLCLLLERVLANEFQEGTYSSFHEFQKQLLHSNWQNIFYKYPVSKKLYLQREEAIVTLISFIIKSFATDIAELKDNSFCSSSDIIQDIDWGQGDMHSGLSTTIITLNGGKKMIFKPTDGSITNAYHQFLDWVDSDYSLGKYEYRTLNKFKYHWQEYINHEPCHSKKDIFKYYQRAGWQLCLVYLLNGRDFHSENVIAKGSHPILIDHEMMVSPMLSRRFRVKTYNPKIEDSIFDSSLISNIK